MKYLAEKSVTSYTYEAEPFDFTQEIIETEFTKQFFGYGEKI